MDKLRLDRVVLFATLALAAAYFYLTESLPKMRVGDPLGPKAFPRLLFVGLLIAAALIFLEIRRKRAEAGGEPSEEKAAKDPPAWGLLAAIVACTGIYFVAFESLGYVLATIAYLVVLTSYLNPGKWATNVLASVGFAFASYLSFEFLGVALPQGLLPL